MSLALIKLIQESNPSSVIVNNCIELIQREVVGTKKYGVTLDDAKLTHEQVLQHLLEEQLDAANYTRKSLMVATAARRDYAELRNDVEKLIARLSPYGHAEEKYARNLLTDLLFRFDVSKVGRDLK